MDIFYTRAMDTTLVASRVVCIVCIVHVYCTHILFMVGIFLMHNTLSRV